MITFDQMKIYRKYRGDEDRLARFGGESEIALFTNNDWGLIRDYEQNIELISKRLTSEEFKNKTLKNLRNNSDLHSFIELTKMIPEIVLEMKQHYFDIFLNVLLTATSQLQEKYFRLPVAYEQQFVFRERAYCYELYHLIRQQLPNDFPYILSGEVNKAGHPRIAPICGSIIPDFLVHNPGHMGANDNLIIVEVKTVQGADYNQEGKDLLKDMGTINCMTQIENGYFKGIILVFGSGHDNKKTEIVRTYRENCNTDKVLLILHDNPMTKGRVI